MGGIDDAHGGGGERLRVGQATEEEQAAIRAMLNKRAESAPARAGAGRASALAWAGLRLAAVVLLAAGVEVGLVDGDEFDDVGCSVAQQPGGTSHDARSAQARERAGGKKLPGSEGGAAGGSGDGGPCGGKAETLKAEREAAMERFEGKLAGLRKDFADWQKSPRPANEAGLAAPPEPARPDEPNLSLAARVFELLTALDPEGRLRKAPLIKVFLLRFRKNLSRSAIADVCQCSESLVAIRLRAIEAKLPWRPQQLRELSAHVEAMEDAVSDSRARRIYRKGAVCGDQEDDEESE
jgi:hypothetical protein